MSQAGFGDSSPQESINPLISETQSQSQSLTSNVLGDSSTLLNTLPRQVLEQELQFCNERSQQAQVLLRQAQEQLQLSQLVIQRQETLTLTLQARIDQLERELQDVHTNCDELRDRLKRQQHHTSQLKAALERCLDTSTPAPKDMALSALESWSIAKLADEKITPVEAINDSPLQNVVKINPAPQPIDIPETQEITTSSQVSQEPETIEEPISLSIPAKNQPISPLIVRPHKASQGSPIAPNLPKWKPSFVAEQKEEREERSIEIASQVEQKVLSFHESNPIVANDLPSNESAISSGSVVKSPPMMSTVVAPKFIQALYGNANEEIEEPTQLAIANSAPRKAVTSLAAVQLPQFPPLPRR
ncbi:hypothetical protein [Pseudanabaena sp. ABRG5-3]|uniref:hypothetical protein n=1 Tax=Pseudanabaena sp. ABRG5-3 TaxID=685565 RepID=UPI000DC6F6FC|nr:hypothetical protein [Pseudanabaena sp. ABRG5-3]BBC23646.1 hypothetical protein ABRG53_1389 [Pseudanabaena sp. ABRG5-3]